MNADPIAVVEASYRVNQTPAAWLDGVAHAVAPALDAGAGLVAMLVENPRQAAALPAVVATATVGATDNDLRTALVLRAAATPAGRVPFRAAGSASTLRRTLGPAFDAPGGVRELLAPTGYDDVEYLLAGMSDHLTCAIATGRAGRARRARHHRRLLEQLAAHVGAGARLLRARIRGETLDEPEAVIDPAGRLCSACGPAASAPARAALRRAALACDRARGRLRRSAPADAVALWSALVSGRWSLVDHFDSDGRRFLLARRNEPMVAPLPPLTVREAQVVGLAAEGRANKLIAYELGLSVGTVSTHLARARAKLGGLGRIELVDLFPR
jgi:DNA-binding CsgD family transcriptional regulator